jgi:predicted nuclease of predicted toxin-antitoxin system
MTLLLLANENIPAPSVDYLRTQGYDVRAVAECDAGLRDFDVLRMAVAERRWLLTFDRDYGELIFARGMPIPPAVIYFRLASYRPEDPGRLLADLLIGELEMLGQFVVVEDHGLRKRPLPSKRLA